MTPTERRVGAAERRADPGGPEYAKAWDATQRRSDRIFRMRERIDRRGAQASVEGAGMGNPVRSATHEPSAGAVLPCPWELPLVVNVYLIGEEEVVEVLDGNGILVWSGDGWTRAEADYLVDAIHHYAGRET